MKEILKLLKSKLEDAGVTEKIYINTDKFITNPCVSLFSISLGKIIYENKEMTLFVNTRDTLENALRLPDIIQNVFRDILSVSTAGDEFFVIAIIQNGEFTWNESKLISGKKIAEANCTFQIIYQ